MPELVNRLYYVVGNPSAWPDGFNPEISELIREAVTELQQRRASLVSPDQALAACRVAWPNFDSFGTESKTKRISEMRAALSVSDETGDGETEAESSEYDPDAPPDHSADNAADFIFGQLSKALGVDGKWSVSDGTETWDGDVSGTLYNILIAAGIWDDDEGKLIAPAPTDETQGVKREPVGYTTQAMLEALQEPDTICGTIWPKAAMLATIPLFSLSQLEAVERERDIMIEIANDLRRKHPLAWKFELIEDANAVAASAEASLAAAPDMLEALHRAKEWLEGWASAESQLAVIDAAISKAEGAPA